MRRLLVLLLLVASPGHAKDDCAALRQAFHVPDPGPSVGTQNIPIPFDCTPEESAMLVANMNAIEDAKPVTSVEQLYGTWLGDNVLLYVASEITFGQEVLRISEGDSPNTIKIEQLWFSTYVHGDNLSWDGSSYSGRITMGTLEQKDSLDMYWANYDTPLRYSNITFNPERGSDLFIKGMVNHFDFPVKFGLSNDTLVLRGNVRTIASDGAQTVEATFTRVAHYAPDLALIIVLEFEVSALEHFDCLVHQLSSGEGRLFEAIAPAGLPELEAYLRERHVLRQELQKLHRNEVLSDAQKEALSTSMTRFIEMDELPVAQALRDALSQGDGLGCPRLQR